MAALTGAITQRELAFFGGHAARPLVGGDVPWGSPLLRVQEFAPAVASGVLLPGPSEWLQPGVPFFVVNTGTANLAVKRPNGTTVWTVTAGNGAILVPGADWFVIPRATPQFGVPYPPRRYEFELTIYSANVNLMQLAVALGYDGSGPAALSVLVRSAALVGSAQQALPAITTGAGWPAGSYWLLVVEPDAVVGGWGGIGGRGGVPGTGASGGANGGNGGIAVHTEIPMRIDCRSHPTIATRGGKILGGGGGGGGGGSSSTNLTIIGGGGGGGRGVSMSPGGVLLGSTPGLATFPANPGSSGAPSIVGTGGSGSNGGGTGGVGGDAGLSGAVGGAGPGAGGFGGLGAAAITYTTAAGAPVVLAGGANILGGIVAV